MGYATHPVVHQWVYRFQDRDWRAELAQLAVIVVGWAVPDRSTQEYWIMQSRFFPHAQMCSQWIVRGLIEGKHSSDHTDDRDLREREENVAKLDAIHSLGMLYKDRRKLAEAEKMYQRALQGYKKALGAEHILTLDTVGNLGILYADQGKLAEAEKMYQRTLQGYKKTFGSLHPKRQNLVLRISALHACHSDEDREACIDRTATTQQQAHPTQQGGMETSSVRKGNEKKQRFLRLRKLLGKAQD